MELNHYICTLLYFNTMANVKNGAFREIIIDRCLQSRRGYSTQEILEKCNNALERRGEMPVTASNTIRNDILSIENRWNIVVEAVRDGRNVRYRYKDPSFSIFNSPLNEDEIALLTQSVTLLRRFEGMPGFEWVDELNAHLQTTVNTTATAVVGFDENQQLKGRKHFTPLFNYINSNQVIHIIYKPYKGEAIDVDVHPYFLKEYNQRWFLFGLTDREKRISNYALDRIEYFERSEKKYIPNTSLDFAHYFDNVIGVSIHPEREVMHVKLWVDKEQLAYTLSKPLHKTQKLVRTNEDGSAVISIDVALNFELIQLLLSFGDRVVVLSPACLRQNILARIEKNIENYKKVQLD